MTFFAGWVVLVVSAVANVAIGESQPRPLDLTRVCVMLALLTGSIVLCHWLWQGG